MLHFILGSLSLPNYIFFLDNVTSTENPMVAMNTELYSLNYLFNFLESFLQIYCA